MNAFFVVFFLVGFCFWFVTRCFSLGSVFSCTSMVYTFYSVVVENVVVVVIVIISIEFTSVSLSVHQTSSSWLTWYIVYNVQVKVNIYSILCECSIVFTSISLYLFLSHSLTHPLPSAFILIVFISFFLESFLHQCYFPRYIVCCEFDVCIGILFYFILFTLCVVLLLSVTICLWILSVIMIFTDDPFYLCDIAFSDCRFAFDIGWFK